MLAAEREKRFAQANRQRDELVARMQAKRQLEQMQATLRCKQELLDDAFSAARHELTKRSSARTALLRRLWLHASRQIAVATVIVAKRDEAMFRNKGVRIKTQEGLGGFIAQSADGKVRIDLRFETLLDDVRARSTARITEILFKEQQSKPVKAPSKTKAKAVKSTKKVRR
jgi:vacuolar-type H+-ATPase subunit E/Vma4